MSIFRLAIASLALSSSVSSAEVLAHGRWAAPTNIVTRLGLDTERANRVEAILENSVVRMKAAWYHLGPGKDETTRLTMHAAIHAILQDTKRQLSIVLTDAELAALSSWEPPYSGIP
jgi:hypothetical protein